MRLIRSMIALGLGVCVTSASVHAEVFNYNGHYYRIVRPAPRPFRPQITPRMGLYYPQFQTQYPTYRTPTSYGNAPPQFPAPVRLPRVNGIQTPRDIYPGLSDFYWFAD